MAILLNAHARFAKHNYALFIKSEGREEAAH